MIRTTAAGAVCENGYIKLIIHTLDEQDVLGRVEFDIDAYALELASQLLATVVQQKSFEQ